MPRFRRKLAALAALIVAASTIVVLQPAPAGALCQVDNNCGTPCHSYLTGSGPIPTSTTGLYTGSFTTTVSCSQTAHITVTAAVVATGVNVNALLNNNVAQNVCVGSFSCTASVSWSGQLPGPLDGLPPCFTGNGTATAILDVQNSQQLVTAGSPTVTCLGSPLDPGAGPTNTGDADVPLGDQVADTAVLPDPALVVENTQLVASVAQYASLALAGQFPAACDFCPPRASTVAHPLASQNTTYTCAPSAGRNILAGMGISVSEETLAAEMKTRSDNGTWFKSIAPALNRHTSSRFVDQQVGSPAEFLTYLMAGIGRKNRQVMLNVQMAGLPYYHQHTGRHYLNAYGYDGPNQFVKIADEWDPTRFNIPLRSYGNVNPYGEHTESLAATYGAVRANKGIIIW